MINPTRYAFTHQHALLPPGRMLKHPHLPEYNGPYVDGMDIAACPTCGHENVHTHTPYTMPGNDNYDAGWGGRGDLTVVPFEGECGHYWSRCFGFHKGTVDVFIAVPRRTFASVEDYKATLAERVA